MRLGLERQDAGVFEEDERLANRFAGHGPLLGRAEQLVAARVTARRRLARVEQAQELLDAPAAPHALTEPRHPTGSAYDRERVGQYVEILDVGETLTKKKNI